MKNISTLLTGMLCLLSLIITAQTRSGKINGVITDTDAQPVASATASLLRAKDSVLVKVAVSDRNGLFEFENLAAGEYFVMVTAIGFSKNGSKRFTVTSSPYKLPAFQLQQSAAKTLGQVTVTGKRPLIENKIDRMVVNVEAAPTNAGASALEVLEKSPGITVSNDGEISLKGKQGVKVMIDGKPTYLSPADLANVLKNLPASALDQIEIMTNPPARYDASGNSGIINIKTKKSLTEGLNGSVTVGGSVGLFHRNDSWYAPLRNNSSINLNYRKGKWNLFGNYNYNYREGKGYLDLTRRFFEKDGSLNSTSSSHSDFNFRNNNYTLKLGFDYYANKKNIIGMVINGFGFFGRPASGSLQNISRPDGSIESVLATDNFNKNNFYNYSANLNYKHTFDSTGRELTADLDYMGYTNNAQNNLLTTVYDNYGGNVTGNLTLFGDIPGIINIYSAKTDYVHPLKKNLEFDAGFKVSYVKNDNEVKYQRNDNGAWKPDDRSNHFIYEENINAGYISLNKKWKKWSGQAGLRIENTNAKGKQLTNDSGFNRNYTSLFPTMYLNYEASKNHAFTLSFGRRIERPNYQDLNPFIWFLDSLQYRQGNPYLLPQYAYNMELRHTLKGKITTTINYTITDDVISQLLKQNTEKRITYLTPDNVARFKNTGVAINAPFTPVKNWNVNLFVNVFNNRFEGTYYNSFTGTNDPIDISYTSALINISNTFSFKKGWSGEISGFYRGKTIEQLTIVDPMYFLNLGVQKIVLKGKGTLRMNIRDPFHWQQYNGHTLYSDIDVKMHNKWDNRSLTITFSYRFGKTSVAQARRRTSGVTEEQNRAGGGQQ